MKLNVWRDEIEVTPLVPPYAKVDSWRMGPLHVSLEVELPQWMARLYGVWIRVSRRRSKGMTEQWR
jgi:hypothetical protein